MRYTRTSYNLLAIIFQSTHYTNTILNTLHQEINKHFQYLRTCILFRTQILYLYFIIILFLNQVVTASYLEETSIITSGAYLRIFNANLPEGSKVPPQYILFYNFLVTNSSKFHEIMELSLQFYVITIYYSSYYTSMMKLVTFPKIYLGLIFWVFFSKLKLVLQCQHFFTTRCYFLCMSSVGIMNISLVILVVFEFRDFRKILYSLF